MSREMKDTLRNMAAHPFRTLGEVACVFSMFPLGYVFLVVFGS